MYWVRDQLSNCHLFHSLVSHPFLGTSSVLGTLPDAGTGTVRSSEDS